MKSHFSKRENTLRILVILWAHPNVSQVGRRFPVGRRILAITLGAGERSKTHLLKRRREEILRSGWNTFSLSWLYVCGSIGQNLKVKWYPEKERESQALTSSSAPNLKSQSRIQIF